MGASWMTLLLETALLVDICVVMNPFLIAFFLCHLPNGEKNPSIVL
jgi:hypothetical protein